MNNHIQISDVTPRIQYAADGSQTQFSYPFPIFVEDDLEVYSDDTKEISGYSVLGAGTSYGGSVTFDTPPASGVIVTLRRSLAIDRTTDFQQSGAFRAKDINDELDSLTAALQQVADDVGRAVRLRPTDGEADLELPSKGERANKVLGFDASGDVIATSGSGVTGAGVTDHGQLTGLSDDDHSQYHNDARGDARYYTQGQIDAALGGKSDTSHNHDTAYAAISHVSDSSNPHGITKSQVGLDNVENIKINLSASVDPSQNDDGNDGYTVGSRWINTALDREFVCVDAALGAAVWIETTQTGGSGVSDHGSLTGLGDDDHAQYHTDSRADSWLAGKTLDDITAGATNKYFDAADQVKLNGIEPGATSDMTGGEIKAAYEAEADTNAFTDADKVKLAGIEAGAEVNDVDTVFGRTGDVDIASLAEETSPASTDWVVVEKSGGGFRKTKTSNLPAGAIDHGQLPGLSDDDHGQYHTDARGDARYYTQSALDAGQLDGRYYTETEVDAQFAVLGSAAALDVGTAVADVVQLEDVGGGTPGLPAVDGSQLTGLPGGGDMLAATYDPQAIAADAFDADNHTDGTTNKVYTATEKNKLAGIEAGATADQTASEIETAYNAQVSAASQGEMEAGTETAIRRMSPLRIAQAIAALAGSGGGGLNIQDDHTTTGALNLTSNSKIAATAVPSSTTLPAIAGSDHQIELVNHSGSQIIVARNGSDIINVDGIPGQTTVTVPDKSTALFHVNSTRTVWHVQIASNIGEANTTSNAGSGLSILGTTPKLLGALLFRGLKALAAGSSIALAHDDTNNDVDFSLVNDQASPGNNMVYGTNSSGTKGWKEAVLLPPVTYSGTGRTYAADDATTCVLYSNGSAKTLTISAGDGQAAGHLAGGINTGAGDLTLVQGSGMTLNGNKVFAQGEAYAVYFESATVGHVIGGSAT